MLGLNDEQLSDSVPSVVPLGIITLLTLLFVVHNPWGWKDWFLILEIFGLHLVPILTLAPVTYLVVKLVSESGDGHSETGARIRSWFMADESMDTAEIEDENKNEHEGEPSSNR